MTAEIALKALAIWGIILVLAVANGAFRETVLIPRLGNTPALVLSGSLLSALIVAVAYLFLPWLGSHVASQLWLIGLAWLLLTLIFEFSFGLGSGKDLSEVLAAYTFRDGNIWPVVLLVTLLAPWLAAKLRGLL